MHPEALQTFASMKEKTGFDILRYAARPVSGYEALFAPLDAEPDCEKIDFPHCGESPFVFCALGCATVIDRRLCRQVRWTSLVQGEDMVFVMDCLLKTTETFRTSAKLIDYCMGQGSASHRVSVSLLRGTCEYLPVMMGKADDLGVDPGMLEAGEAFAREMLLRRMPGAWRLLAGETDRRAVEDAFWKSLQAMSERPSFADGFCRRAISLAVRRRSLLLLRMLVTLPYRLRRKAFWARRDKALYDLVLSVGVSCECSVQLRASGLQHLSFPMDWILRPSFGVDIALLTEGFRSLLVSPDDLALESGECGGCLRLVDRRRGFHLWHDFPPGIPVEESFAAVKAKYDRRMARLLSLIGSSRRILLVWMGEPRCEQKTVPTEEIVAAEKALSGKWPGKTFDFLILQNRPGVSPENAERSSGPHFKRFTLDYMSKEKGAPVWRFDERIMRTILSSYAVRDYRTSAERRGYSRRRRVEKWRRYGASSWLAYVAARAEFCLWRRLDGALRRKGVRVD